MEVFPSSSVFSLYHCSAEGSTPVGLCAQAWSSNTLSGRAFCKKEEEERRKVTKKSHREENQKKTTKKHSIFSVCSSLPPHFFILSKCLFFGYWLHPPWDRQAFPSGRASCLSRRSTDTFAARIRHAGIPTPNNNPKHLKKKKKRNEHR